jgi:hypothetical protein
MSAADVRVWHEPADPECPLSGHDRVINGQLMFNVSSSLFDLERS